MIIDLFAGLGGWSEGLRLVDLADVGIEWDAAACATRAAAGHLTIRADVATYPPERFAGAEGLIASPPCPDWSIAGKGARRAGTSGHLVDVVPEWVGALRPRWVACEQVPPVLEVWHEHAALYRTWGYSTWAGILNAADFGVPQTRRRAILLARLDGPALPPEPTHCQGGGSTMFGTLAPWVSMAEALGWGDLHRPCTTLVTPAGGGRNPIDGGSNSRRARVSRVARGEFAWPRIALATTITGDPRATARCHHDEGSQGSQGANAKTTDQVQAGDYEGTGPIRLTLAEALTLQSFPPDYPVQGTKTKQFEQVGNACPPLLSAHILSAVTGVPLCVPEVAA